MVRVQPFFGALALAWVAVTAASGGCGSKQGSGFGDNSSSSGGGGGGASSGSGQSSSSGFSVTDIDAEFGGSSGGPAPTCTGGSGWNCKVNPSCGATSSTPTTLTGKVFDPAGKNPLYDVVVFIPDDATTLPAITQGTHQCNTCDVSIGHYVVATQTDASGSFTLKGVPTASGVPVTVQIGKWRRTVNVNITNDCSVNKVSDGTLRLPGKKSEGDMPEMALLTGGCDDMACFLLNMGISASEFGAPHAGGRVDVYQGNSMPLGIGGSGPSLSNGTAGNCTTTSCPLWASKASFEAYDIAVFSCECSEQTSTNESPAGYTNLHDWLNEGGKVFASHYHYTWFKNNPDPQWVAVATWLGTSIAAGSGMYDLNTTFPKGMTFGTWLGNVGALAGNGPPPTITLASVATSVSAYNKTTAQQWIYDPSSSDTKYLSFGTPIGGAKPPDGGAEAGKQYCGKAVFTDLHTSSSLLAMASSVPAMCTAAPLTAQQKALEFLFFDLSACVTDDTVAPPPPPPNPM